ncbi:MAG: TfoX/Sxy family protein [Alphaproteobacteria bacterium]|nr:TfoX/Sxy family protein [Alphaproteobacteria bacterium]MBO4644242.1 TfoX/Sxy family protein [Alphaproteobacteria bacterium]
MASSKEYLDFVLEQLSDPDGITYRAMMGEYVLYYRGKVFGGIYDDRFLVKPVKAAVAMMPDAQRELPYEGAKEMLLVDDIDDRAFLRDLLNAMYDELPEPKKKK